MNMFDVDPAEFLEQYQRQGQEALQVRLYDEEHDEEPVGITESQWAALQRTDGSLTLAELARQPVSAAERDRSGRTSCVWPSSVLSTWSGLAGESEDCRRMAVVGPRWLRAVTVNAARGASRSYQKVINGSRD